MVSETIIGFIEIGVKMYVVILNQHHAKVCVFYPGIIRLRKCTVFTAWQPVKALIQQAKIELSAKNRKAKVRDKTLSQGQGNT
jgi:hypothetical protein